MAKPTLHLTKIFEESESVKRFRENHGMEYDDFLEMLTDLLEENDEAFEEEMKTFIITIKLMHTPRETPDDYSRYK